MLIGPREISREPHARRVSLMEVFELWSIPALYQLMKAVIRWFYWILFELFYCHFICSF